VRPIDDADDRSTPRPFERARARERERERAFGRRRRRRLRDGTTEPPTD
jgi:hypothetical protein|tara:strand:+ start:3644 stop:3790 length:147 start_codon:yes stop_codon:yes gene_type:complete